MDVRTTKKYYEIDVWFYIIYKWHLYMPNIYGDILRKIIYYLLS